MLPEKNDFLVPKSLDITRKYLSTEEKALLFDAIFEYELNGVELIDTLNKTILSLAFEIFKHADAVNEEKYKQRCERHRESGRLGGLKKAQNQRLKLND